MKVLCYTSPARGHLFPTVPILLELRGRGHDVVVRTLDAEVARLRDLGLKAEPISPEIEAIELDDYRARTSQAGLKRTVRTFAARARIEVPEVQRLVAEEHPDLLLVDGNTWGAAAVAEASGLPWALLQHFPTPLPARDVPPFGPGLRPLAGPLGRLRNRLLRPVVLGVVERAFLPPLNEVVRPLAGASPIRDAHDLYTRAPLTLYPTSRAFEHPRTDWPDSFCFVGPLVWEPPTAPPEWLAELGRPVALVTTSSEYQDDGALVDAALAGLAHEDLDVVATLPGGSRPRRLVPANAHVEQFVPHSPVLARAAVAVTHGGMGATQKALAAGVPVVVVPWGRDQAEVARRAEATGAAVLLPRRRLSPTSLRDAVRRARRLRPAAVALAAAMAQDGGAPLAVDRLESLAGRG
ncbi:MULTISPECIES: glycosyltransferase [unclassified Nocardioides]|uniref:glycosyltransferase n=1 Tax=unclassified Nocardioides TaxID=2615069 RepID=UPI0000571279|nr:MULTISPECIES: glycosyltransferase [unclassified Nocardioides]ABL82468.1 glycosyltransferase, MGT family [Nocardioides sp. JS614]